MDTILTYNQAGEAWGDSNNGSSNQSAGSSLFYGIVSILFVLVVVGVIIVAIYFYINR